MPFIRYFNARAAHNVLRYQKLYRHLKVSSKTVADVPNRVNQSCKHIGTAKLEKLSEEPAMKKQLAVKLDLSKMGNLKLFVQEKSSSGSKVLSADVSEFDEIFGEIDLETNNLEEEDMETDEDQIQEDKNFVQSQTAVTDADIALWSFSRKLDKRLTDVKNPIEDDIFYRAQSQMQIVLRALEKGDIDEIIESRKKLEKFELS